MIALLNIMKNLDQIIKTITIVIGGGNITVDLRDMEMVDLTVKTEIIEDIMIIIQDLIIS